VICTGRVSTSISIQVEGNAPEGENVNILFHGRVSTSSSIQVEVLVPEGGNFLSRMEAFWEAFLMMLTVSTLTQLITAWCQIFLIIIPSPIPRGTLFTAIYFFLLFCFILLARTVAIRYFPPLLSRIPSPIPRKRLFSLIYCILLLGLRSTAFWVSDID
jgi:magnesium-transporting ATPase (P-type)